MVHANQIPYLPRVNRSMRAGADVFPQWFDRGNHEMPCVSRNGLPWYLRPAGRFIVAYETIKVGNVHCGGLAFLVDEIGLSLECPYAHHRNASGKRGWLVDDAQYLRKLSRRNVQSSKNIGTNGEGPVAEQLGAQSEVSAEHHKQFVTGE